MIEEVSPQHQPSGPEEKEGLLQFVTHIALKEIDMLLHTSRRGLRHHIVGCMILPHSRFSLCLTIILFHSVLSSLHVHGAFAPLW